MPVSAPKPMARQIALLLAAIVLLAGAFPTPVAAAAPTHRDVRYSADFDRSTLYLWLPQSERPAPLVVYFHGGGFRMGDKRRIQLRRQFLAFTDQGVAVASVGYPFLGDQGKTDTIGPSDYDKIFAQAATAVRFLNSRAEEYRLDPKRTVVAGSSAGALIAEFLTYREDLSLTCCIALEQPWPVEMVTAEIDRGEPPLVLYTRVGPDDKIHNPKFARQVKQHCDRVGVTCYLYGRGGNGLPELPDEQSFASRASEIVFDLWKAAPATP